MENPAAPSPSSAPQFPSLLGEWRGAGILELRRADGSSFGHHACPSFWTVQSQEGGSFAGRMQLMGNGSASDKLCGFGGSFSGTMGADGAVLIRLGAIFIQACAQAGDSSVLTGAARSDGTLFLETSAPVTCDASQQYETGTATITFNLSRLAR